MALKDVKLSLNLVEILGRFEVENSSGNNISMEGNLFSNGPAVSVCCGSLSILSSPMMPKMEVHKVIMF